MPSCSAGSSTDREFEFLKMGKWEDEKKQNHGVAVDWVPHGQRRKKESRRDLLERYIRREWSSG